MNKIEVKILNEHGIAPGNMMMFLAKLTQRGHSISNMKDLLKLYNATVPKGSVLTNVAKLPHGTIKRFTPITIAIVGASRRFLAQIRTHSVGVEFVSASLQYSNYAGSNDFVVPYEMLDKLEIKSRYLNNCKHLMNVYSSFIEDGLSNDTAGYIAPQGLRNILIVQANHEAWMSIVRSRACNRNTVETQYVVCKIWEALLTTTDGEAMFKYAGPDCMYGSCREGKMTCSSPINIDGPTEFIKRKWCNI